MPHVPNFPSEDTDEPDDKGRDRSPSRIIDRIIDDGELPVTTGI
ncbi:hypothetical protein [Natrinema pellirubrum]|nr:hypothetical protein [Natrinema pellirubrum]